MYNFQRVEVFPASWLHSQRVADRLLRLLWMASASIGCAALLVLMIASAASASSALTVITTTLTSPLVFVPALVSTALFVLAYRRYRRRMQQLARAFQSKLDALELVLNDPRASHVLREQAAFALARTHTRVASAAIRTAFARLDEARNDQPTAEPESTASNLHLREAYLGALWITQGVPASVIRAFEHLGEVPLPAEGDVHWAERQDRAYRMQLAYEAALTLNRQRRQRLTMPAPIATLENDQVLAGRISEALRLMEASAPAQQWANEVLSDDPSDATHLALGGH